MNCASAVDMINDLTLIGLITDNIITPTNAKRPSDEMIDRWACTAALGEKDARAIAIWAIRESALAAGIVPAYQSLCFSCC